MDKYLAFFNEAFALFIFLHGIAGLLGGLGSILLAGEFIKSRWIIDEDGKKVKKVYGSIKEPFVGFLGGILVALPLAGDTSIPILLALSLLTGFGSSKFLKQYIDKKTNEVLTSSTADLSGLQIQVISQEEPTSSDTPQPTQEAK